MTVEEQLASDMAAAIAIRGQTFEWGGTEYPCSRRDTPTAMELQENAGYIEDVLYWLVVAKSSFPDYDPADPTTYPKQGDGINNSAHQVKKVNGHKDPGAAQLILSIGSFDR